jgi:NTE family protein
MKTNSLFHSHFHRITIIVYCLSVMLLLFTSELSFSQARTRRPTVGLVLSGGGAHGIAHLGVIKVMEEAGLKPDYISGTSMGSIIGGMYSLGYSADSLHKLLRNLNWDDMLSNKIPENRIVFPEKSHFYNSIVSLPITSKRMVFPSGLNNGQLIENTLSYYAWPAAEISNFSKLPIPFMCNATDIITYTKVNLKSGYLPDAIRASFSVPSIFTAYKIDTLLLFDGGLIRNFAASEVKEMGADIIIGSYVGFESNHPEELQTLTGIIEQIAMSRSLEDFKQEKKLTNILIKPDVDRFSIKDFNKVDSLIYSGYVAAVPFREKFRKLADSLNRLGAARPIADILDKSSYSFDRIEINGNKVYSADHILGILDIKPGDEVSRDKLTDGIELLYGKAWFEKVKYRIVPRNDSLILAIDCEEKPRAMFYGSVHYDNSLLFGLITGATVKNLLTSRSVIDVNSFIGKYYRFNVGLLQYVDRNQKLGFSMNFTADNTLFPWLDLNNETGNTLSRNQSYEAGINNYLGLNNIVMLSAIYSQTNLKPDYISDSKITNHTYNYLSSELTFARDNLNDKNFPDNGLIINLTAGISNLQKASVQTDVSKTVLTDKAGYAPDNFYTFRAGIKQYISTGEKTTFSIGAEALYISESDSISSQNNFYLLGGIQADTKRSIPMTGFQPNEIKVRKLAIVRSELDFEFFRDLHLSIMADLAATEDNNYPYEMLVLSGYGLGLGYNSIIGPVKAGVMYGSYLEEKHFSSLKAYISIGYNF